MATKTLRVTLADILGPAGPSGRVHGEVWAQYVDGNGAPREIRYTDGTVVVMATPRVTLDALGVADFLVVPSDDPTVHASDRGFGVKIGWDLTERGARGTRRPVPGAGKVVQVVTADPAVVQFGAKADYVPVIPGSVYLTQTAGDVRYAPFGSGASDAAVSALVTTPASATATALGSAYAPTILGLSNGTDDTTALNAILATAGGKVAKGVHGQTYLIADALVLQSGTVLDMTGCTVRFKTATGITTNMVVNAAANTVRRCLDAVTTAASTTLTSATAAFVAGDVGKPVTIQGAGTAGAAHTTTVASVTNGTTAVLTVAAVTSVSGQYAAIGVRDQNITVRGGTWDRRGNTNSTTHYLSHTMRFRHLDGLTVRDLTMIGTSGKYAINPGDCTDVEIAAIRFPSYYSDGIHLNGPVARVVIHDIFGDFLGDDLVSLTARDSTVAITDCAGDITDVLVDGVYLASSDPAQFASALKIVAGKTTDGSAPYSVRRITARNLTAPCATGAVAYMGDQSLGNMDDITIDGARSLGKGAGTYDTIYFAGGSYDRIVLKRIMHHANDRHPVLVNGMATASSALATITSLLVEDAVWLSGGPVGRGVVQVDGVVTSLKMRGCVHRGASGGSLLCLTNGISPKPSVTRATISDSHLQVAAGGSGAGIVRCEDAAATLGVVELSNIVCANSNYALGFYGGSVTILAKNVRSEGVSLSSWLRIKAGTATVYADGLSGTLDGANIDAGAFVRSKGFGLPIDVGQTGVVKTLGDTAYNTNAARACGVGPVVSDGTAWKGLYTGATF